MRGGVVCAYVHDSSAKLMDCAVYEPNTSLLNRCIQEWSRDGVAFCGIVHSHPRAQTTLSSDDTAYISELYRVNPWLKVTYYPLVLNQREIFVFKAENRRGLVKIERDSIILVK